MKKLQTKMSGIHTYKLEQVRHSRETSLQKKTFVVLDGHELGLEIDWDKEMFSLFLFKDSKKNVVMKTETLSLLSDRVSFNDILFGLISEYYKSKGKDAELPMYTKIELAIYMSHLHYHIWANTLTKVLEKEQIF